MTAVRDAAVALEAALQTVDGVRIYRDLGANVDPPAVVIGPPNLSWDMLDTDPSRAVFQVWVISPADDRTMERLWEIVPAVAVAAADYDRAAVGNAGATPSTYPSGGVDLPAYIVSVEVAL